MIIPFPTLPGYIFRFARLEDLPAVHKMFVRAVEADRTSHVDTLEDMTNEFIDAWSDPEKDWRIGSYRDRGWMWGCFAGEARKTPPQNRSTTVNPRDPKDYHLALTSDNQVAAMGRVYVNPNPRRECHANLWGEVHPEHRGRGLGVDTESPTGALGLYERLGFKDIKRSITFSKPLG